MFDRLRAVFRRLIRGGSDRERQRRMCMGNTAAVQRLIGYEKKRSPSISEAEACRRAILRFKRDNG
jgi:hypothetical protein